VIRFEAVTKRYPGGTVAVDALDLEAPSGKITVLVGPSGCGKTTSLRMVNRMIEATSGRIWLDDRDTAKIKPAVLRRGIGYVIQHAGLFPHRTVVDNVATVPVLLGRSRREARRAALDLLERVGLPAELAERYPAQLSGGQQQRIALARALATSPSLLLLDEPLSALDAIVRVKLRQEIRSLQRQLGVTTIMVTHDQEEAFAVADRIVVMNQGAIEQVGDAMQVYREPRSLFVADFVGRINVLAATALDDGRVRVGAHDFHCGHRFEAGSELRVYLRPEDVLARPIPAGDPNVFDAQIEKIEFMGPYCLVRVGSPALAEHKLTVYLSLNYLAEAQLDIGSRMPLRVVPERMRIFE
jgi:iron(III) transport system ATP-binding protein